ncbi:MAG: ATP-binding protein, partial [Clostridia bacterium]|nr:ATP-binding protein [Clostridia bacterium]
GIPMEALPLLFERFYKSDRSRGLDKNGMGLGLYIVKTNLASHGESIHVTSVEGQFTCFRFTLPLAPQTIATAGIKS